MTHTPQQRLWLAIIAATVEVINAANARTRSERQEFRNGLMAAYGIITGDDVEILDERLAEAIANLSH